MLAKVKSNENEMSLWKVKPMCFCLKMCCRESGFMPKNLKSKLFCLGRVKVLSQDVSQSPSRFPLSGLGNENQHKLMQNSSGLSLALGRSWNWPHVTVHEVLSQSVLLLKLDTFYFVLSHVIQLGSKLSHKGLLIGKKQKAAALFNARYWNPPAVHRSS